MPRVPILLTVLSLALLSLPAAALANSAGGEQYVDPLAGLNGGDGSGSSGGTADSSGTNDSSSSGAAPSSGDTSSSGGASTTRDSSNSPSSSAPGSEATAVTPSSSAAPAVDSGVFSSPGLVWGIAVVLFLALAGGGFALWRRSHGRS